MMGAEQLKAGNAVRRQFDREVGHFPRPFRRVAPLWYLLYDGGPTRADSYDEFTRLAAGFDPVHLRPVSGRRPWVRSSQASGSVRYVDALIVDGVIHYYYEYARADRAHELRHAAVPLG